MKKILKARILFALFILLYLILVGFTLWAIQGKGYTAEGIQMILLNPGNHISAMTVQRNAPIPVGFPKTVAKTVSLCAFSTDALLAITAYASVALAGALAIFVMFELFGGKGGSSGGGEKKQSSH